jgi:putative tricarboxylic transport membrane protein
MEDLLYGFSVALTPANLLFALIGAFLGTVIGVLPGLGPVGSMALLLGLTYGMPPTTALIMFAGIYYGSMFGGSTTSILVNIPGEATSVITALDGNQMAKAGRGGAALCLAALGSFVAGTIGLVLLTFLAPTMAAAAVKFGPPEYFAIAVFGLIVLSQLSGDSMAKSLVMVAVGLALGTIGLDVLTGQPRLYFGTVELQQGIDFIPIAMGLFGIAEVLQMAEEKMSETSSVIKVKLKELLPNKLELKRSIAPCLRGSFLGFFVGQIPGPSAIISTFLSYAIERKLSKRPEEFGKGAPEGVAGPESANNSAAVGAFAPLLSLGIPFAPPTALLLSAMLIHGITPGPLLIKEHPDIFWGVIASMYIGNLMLLILNLPMVGLFVRILRVPTNLLMPIILMLCLIGSYSISNSVTDVWIMIVSGIAGYFFRRFNFSVTPLVLALVMGPMMENSLRQSLLMSQGSYSIFVTQPISCAIFLIVLASLAVPFLVKISRKRQIAA